MNAHDSHPRSADPVSSRHDERLAGIFAKLMDRVQGGEEVDLGATCADYPEFAVELRQL